MQAVVLQENGPAQEAFELLERNTPVPGKDEVLIQVEAFGLNFADVMARLGHYRDCPPLPTVLGYEVVGGILDVGSNVRELKTGQRVLAFTRFGGYATHVAADSRAVVPIPDAMDAGKATALATQYCTAYFAAEEMVKLKEGDHVVIQAAAGGVGTALVQLCKHHRCIVYGAAGSEEKLDYLLQIGVDHPINYRKKKLHKEVLKIMEGGRPDVIFNSVGGSTVKKGYKTLGPGGRMVCYGAADVTGKKKGVLTSLKQGYDFGFMFLPFLIMESKGIIGVNMLRIADEEPEVLNRVMTNVVELFKAGVIDPVVGAEFPVERVVQAHEYLESRQSIGKVVVKW
jgi:NADPH2:quinone reductase